MNKTTVFSIGLLLTLAAACRAQLTITEFPLPAGGGPPQGIAVGPDGALWFTEFDATRGIDKIGRITVNGAFTEYSLAAGTGPQGITAGPDGAMWFTESLANKIGRITTTGAVTEFPALAGQSVPYAITTGPDGALWFTEGGGGKVGRITTGGVVTEFPVTVGAGPTGIANGPDGALWFTEFIGNHMGRITTNGTLTEFPLPTGFSWRQDITAGPDGNLWFTEQDNDNIGRITTAGVVTMFPLPAGSGPVGIAVGTDGALWFLENGADKFGRITIAGAITDFSFSALAPNRGLQDFVKGPDGALWFTERTGNKIGRAALPAGVFPPTIAAAFGAAVIPLHGSTSLSFTITNPNVVALSGVGFTGNLPVGLNVATPNGLTGSCGTGSVTTTASSVNLASGTIVASGSCTFSVNVTGIAAGNQVTTTGAVTSANGGAGNTASATVTVASALSPDLTVGVSHGTAFAQGQNGAVFTVTVTNSGAGPTTGSVSVSSKPAGSLTLTAMAGAGWTCTLLSHTCTRADALAAGGSYSGISITVNVATNAPASVTNTATVTGGGELNTANNSGSDVTAIQPVAFASVTTSPAGLAFSVDSASFFSPQLLSPGSSHTIAAQSPQAGPTGGQYVFKNWSDGGALSHTVSAAASATYTANFDAQYPLTVAVSPAGAGTVTPGSGLFTAGSVVSLQATPASGFKFVNWSGPVSSAGAANSSVAMTGLLTVTANFAAVQPAASTSVTTSPAGLSFSVDGSNFTSPQSLAAGSSHTIATRSPQSGAPGVQYVFKTWSDGGALSHTVTAPAAATTYTATFETQYQLTVAVSPAGSGTVTPSGGFFTAGALATLQAAPAPGFSFTGWTGTTGSAPTIIVPMTGPVLVTANFKAANLPSQTIDFPSPTNRTQGDAPFALTATATSGLPVTFAIVSGPATIAGNILTLTGLGTVVVQASQAGNAKFAAATPVTRSFTVLASGTVLLLTANPPEGGIITASPPNPVITSDTLVAIQAQANPGYVFIGFSGAITGLTNPQSFFIRQASHVIANFARISADPRDQFTFAIMKGNPMPGGQMAPLASSPQTSPAAASPSALVLPGSGGDWLRATLDASQLPAAALLSLNGATASNLAADSYLSYVLATSTAGDQRVLTVKLIVEVVSITGVLDAAGFRGPSLAPEELATAFGFNQAVGEKLATTLPLETTLGGTTLTITDSAGVSRPGLLLYVSSTQVNFLTPAGMAAGPGTLTISNSHGQKGTIPVSIQTSAPGLFSAGATGKGVAAAVVQRFAADGTVSISLAADCGATGQCSPIAIDLAGPGDQVYLSLYGTGIRGASSLSAVSVTIGGSPVEVLFAGAQPSYPGLDQVNVKLGSELAGKGDIVVNLSVDGRAANPVSIRIR